MTWVVFGQLRTILGQLIEQAKEWQPLLAGVLVLLAAIILARGIIKSAKIRATKPAGVPHKVASQDLRVASPSPSIDGESFEDRSGNLETLRSLLRSALSSLASVDVNPDAARLLCTRILAFQGRQFSLPANADRRLRETYLAFLKQFELLQVVVVKEWSPSEASARLIQLNASARALDVLLTTTAGSRETAAVGLQNKN